MAKAKSPSSIARHGRPDFYSLPFPSSSLSLPLSLPFPLRCGAYLKICAYRNNFADKLFIIPYLLCVPVAIQSSGLRSEVVGGRCDATPEEFILRPPTLFMHPKNTPFSSQHFHCERCGTMPSRQVVYLLQSLRRRVLVFIGIHILNVCSTKPYLSNELCSSCSTSCHIHCHPSSRATREGKQTKYRPNISGERERHRVSARESSSAHLSIISSGPSVHLKLEKIRAVDGSPS